MGYLIDQMWVWMLVAFVIGAIIGWIKCDCGRA
jgi:uncharacterized membrane-anchored protein YhcB (DUF1043 family)